MCRFSYRSITCVFVHYDALNKKISIIRIHSNVTQLPKDLLTKISDTQGKTIKFYTEHIFTTGHASSQRSEWLNICFKSFGSMQQEISRWNIFHEMLWFDKYVHHIITQMFAATSKDFEYMQQKITRWNIFQLIYWFDKYVYHIYT